MCPISGGNWNNSSNAGIWALNLNNNYGNSNVNVGARSDLESPLAVSNDRVEQRGVASGPYGRNLPDPLFLVAARRAPERVNYHHQHQQ